MHFSDIHWGRVIVAAILSELGVMAAIFIGMAVYRSLIAPGGDFKNLGERVGYHVAPPAAAVSTYLSAMWAVRGLASGSLINGILIGVISALLMLGFLLSAKPEHRLRYSISFLMRIVGGALAGYLVAAPKA